MRRLSEIGFALMMVLVSLITALVFLLLSASFAPEQDFVAVTSAVPSLPELHPHAHLPPRSRTCCEPTSRSSSASACVA